MKAHLAKLSLALLSTVFLLGCQEQGSEPVGPDGPQFDKKGTGTCDAATNPANPAFPGHCHVFEEQARTDTFTVKLTGDDIFSVGSNIGMEGLYETNPNEGCAAVCVRGFQMKLSSVILDAVTCGVDDLPSDLPRGDDGEVVLTGSLGFGNFLNDYIILVFDHNGAEHYFQSQTELPDGWPQNTGPGDILNVTQGTGEWKMDTKGKNHQKGCTGEGGPDTNNPIAWTAEVTNIT